MQKDLNWLKASIHHPMYAAEALSCQLFEAGAEGVWEDEPDIIGRQVSIAGFSPDKEIFLQRFLPELIQNIAEAFDIPPENFEYKISLEENHDWAEKWKEGLSPVNVSGRLIIAPTWATADEIDNASGSIPTLRLDPGLAFGSGHHATTFLCLEALTKLGHKAGRILDVGSGSGILSMAAAILNSEATIFGIDNDPDTIAVAYENAGRNNLHKRINFSTDTLEMLPGDFDLIVANITLNPLVCLSEGISQKASAQSSLVLSGLLDSQADEASGIYTKLGWQLIEKISHDEWCALIMHKAA